MRDIDRLIDHMVSTSPTLRGEDLTRVGAEARPYLAPLAGPELVRSAVDAIAGLGPLESLLAVDGVTDILVNAPDDVWVERGGDLERADVSFRSDDDVVAMVRRVISPLGLRIDRALPAVDARLPDGSRLHALIPPAAVDHPVVAVRRFTNTVHDMEGLASSGAVTRDGARMLEEIVARRENVLVAGATGTGKTTLLNVLCRSIPTTERIVTIEDAAELDVDGHVVRLEAQPANVEGAGAVTIRSLVRHALRLRPDRIVVGEVRGAEALDMVQALNTGHAGSMSTVHANGPDEAIDRIVTMAAMAPEEVPTATLMGQVRSAIDVVITMRRSSSGRVVAGIHRAEGHLEEVYRCSDG